MLQVRLPEGYELVLGADALELKRPNGSLVAAFGTYGFNEEAVEEAAWQDLKARAGVACLSSATP